MVKPRVLVPPLVILIVAGYLIYNPAVIPNEQGKVKAEEVRSYLVGDGGEASGFLITVWNRLQEDFLRFAKNTKLPKNVTGLPEEIVVEEAVANLSRQVQNLPKEQLQKVKVEFCRDVATNDE